MNEPESYDVTDSTDWLPTPLSGLAGVESALRCQVCKDFYKTPMLTSCNHTFCSLCIRRALSSDGKCPLCRANDQELKLRSNWSMEEVVHQFTGSRAKILEFARRPPPTLRNEGSPKRRLEVEAIDEPRDAKRLRSSARLSASRGAQVTAEMARQEADIPALDESDADIYIDDGLVACPICLQRMKEAQVDKHLDTACPGSPQPETGSGSRSGGTPNLPNDFQTLSRQAPTRSLERLPAINYSMLKEPQLRKKLVELGISTIGNRPMLERRHKEWMTIWNANCDSLHPRKKSDLLHDLDVWERTVGSRAPTMSRSLHEGAQIKDKDFDQAAWSFKHDTSFKDLIANARRSKAQAVQKPVEADTTSSKEEVPPSGTTIPVLHSSIGDLHVDGPGMRIGLLGEQGSESANPAISKDVGSSTIPGTGTYSLGSNKSEEPQLRVRREMLEPVDRHLQDKPLRETGTRNSFT